VTDFKMNLSMLARPDYRVPSAWSGHLGFAGWLVEEHRPTVLVELGTHRGLSFMAFCQAVVANRIDCRCFAVDSWQGDPHAGVYGEEVFSEVSSYRASRYAGFSELLRMRFDDALEYFEDGSVDLLHIDGMHTYDAVKHDFETWLPKLSKRAVVLLHDTSVREREFGVWRYWDELSDKYPSFEFTHSHGLGVVALRDDTLPALTGLDLASVPFVRRLFERLGEREEVDMEIARLNEALDHERGLRRALISMVGREPVMGSDEWSTLRHDIAHIGDTLRADLAHICKVVLHAQEATITALKSPELGSEASALAEPQDVPAAFAEGKQGDGGQLLAPLAVQDTYATQTPASPLGQDDEDPAHSSAVVRADATAVPAAAVNQEGDLPSVGSSPYERKPSKSAGKTESGRTNGLHVEAEHTEVPQQKAGADPGEAPPRAG
jgi:hypothetical protein